MNLLNGSDNPEEDKPEGEEKITVTPWQAMLACFVEASVGTLRHLSVCPGAKVSLQWKENKRHQRKFRLICQCGAQCELPNEPDWAGAWETYKRKSISEPGG